MFLESSLSNMIFWFGYYLIFFIIIEDGFNIRYLMRYYVFYLIILVCFDFFKVYFFCILIVVDIN